MTLLDEAMGWLLISDDRPRVRTARMETSFRSVTPVGIPLTVEVHLVREERRKSFVHGTLLNGDEICAEADGLFISLRAGQI